METVTREKPKKKTRFVRTIAVWTLISLLLQLGLYAFLNHSISAVMNPDSLTSSSPVPTTLNTELPDTDLKNVQVSFDRKYLSYISGDKFKVFDIKENKVIYTKEPKSGDPSGMGVLNYQWLADRDSLIFFYAKSNSTSGNSSKTKTSASPGKSSSSKSGLAKSSASPDKSSSPKVSSSVKAKATAYTGTFTAMTIAEKHEDPHETDSDAGASPKATGKSSSPSVSPNSSPSPSSGSSKSSSSGTSSESSASGAQITELDTLDLSAGSSSPDERHYIDLSSFPAGGQILQIASSTYTNLINITVKSGSTVRLLEIDIMNNSKFLQVSGTIDNIASSDRYGTLYVQSESGKSKQIVSFSGSKRSTVSTDASDIILGTRDGTLYIGQVENDRLVKVLSGAESSDGSKNVSLSQIWEGDIPYSGGHSIIGSDGRVIILLSKTAYIIRNGKSQSVGLNGEKNFVSSDGVEKIELSKDGSNTKVVVEPLSDTE